MIRIHLGLDKIAWKKKIKIYGFTSKKYSNFDVKTTFNFIKSLKKIAFALKKKHSNFQLILSEPS